MDNFSGYIKTIVWLALIALSVIIFFNGGTIQSLVLFILGGIIIGVIFRSVSFQR